MLFSVRNALPRHRPLVTHMQSHKLDVLKHCGRQGKWKTALTLLEELSASGGPLPRAAWGSALGACKQGRRTKEAVRILDQMGSSVDTLACNQVLNMLCQARDYEGVLGVWRAHLTNHGVAGQSAQELHASVPHVRAMPDAESYYQTLCVCAATGRWSDAIQWLYQMVANGVDPGPVHIQQVVRACVRDRRWSEILEVTRETPRELLEKDVVRRSPVVLACLCVCVLCACSGVSAASTRSPSLGAPHHWEVAHMGFRHQTWDLGGSPGSA